MKFYATVIQFIGLAWYITRLNLSFSSLANIYTKLGIRQLFFHSFELFILEFDKGLSDWNFTLEFVIFVKLNSLVLQLYLYCLYYNIKHLLNIFIANKIENMQTVSIGKQETKKNQCKKGKKTQKEQTNSFCYFFFIQIL